MGNRTECGLLQMAVALGADYQALRKEGQVLRTFPFSSERKRMTSIVSEPGSRCELIPCPTFHPKTPSKVSHSLNIWHFASPAGQMHSCAASARISDDKSHAAGRLAQVAQDLSQTVWMCMLVLPQGSFSPTLDPDIR